MGNWKGIRFGVYVAAYLVTAFWIKLTSRNSNDRLRRYTANASFFARLGLGVLNVRVRVKGIEWLDRTKGGSLMVSNHMSYLDALIMAVIRPSVFVTSVDMGEKFFVGTMAEMAGSIFVERRHRGRVEGDKAAMVEALRRGHNVIIYPEGTSTDGSTVLPFKKSLLMAAGEAGVPLLPLTLRYTYLDGQPFAPANHHLVCWYGEMDFFPHLKALLNMREVIAEVTFLPPQMIESGVTRDEVATRAYAAVANSYYAYLQMGAAGSFEQR